MKIELTKSEFDLLVENNILSNLINFTDNDDCILISSNLIGFEILLDNLGDLIAEKGIGDDGEINNFGIRIEKIIDKISDKIW